MITTNNLPLLQGVNQNLKALTLLYLEQQGQRPLEVFEKIQEHSLHPLQFTPGVLTRYIDTSLIPTGFAYEEGHANRSRQFATTLSGEHTGKALAAYVTQWSVDNNIALGEILPRQHRMSGKISGVENLYRGLATLANQSGQSQKAVLEGAAYLSALGTGLIDEQTIRGKKTYTLTPKGRTVLETLLEPIRNNSFAPVDFAADKKNLTSMGVYFANATQIFESNKKRKHELFDLIQSGVVKTNDLARRTGIHRNSIRYLLLKEPNVQFINDEWVLN